VKIGKKKGISILIIVAIAIIAICFYLYTTTGFLNAKNIDSLDKEHWDYEEGVIAKGEGFEINGSDRCWLLIHGYGSTPHDFSELAFRLHDSFNDSIYVPRLRGHAEVPSALRNLSFSDWYFQIEGEFLELQDKCSTINVVGFSMGGAIALKLAEEYQLENLYLISPYLILRYKWWNGISKESQIKIIADLFIYKKKLDVGQINDEEGLKRHISYLTSPLQPIKNSLKDIRKLRNNLGKIDNPILIQQSKNDDTIDVRSSYEIYNKVSSQDKEIRIFSSSNHVLLQDYDKEEAINNIISFEKLRR